MRCEYLQKETWGTTMVYILASYAHVVGKSGASFFR